MTNTDKFCAALSGLLVLAAIAVWYAKMPSTEEVFQQADAHAAAQEVANGR